MTLIAASVVTKGGKALVTRPFVTQMTKARLEGLLDAFPKLVGSDKTQRQHTFVETDSVRYVYQPLDNIYIVLVTTKASNILEDLETLRLFSRVIPEYCKSNEESEILNNAFELIFAFDEIVALGYRESVTLAQIRTFTEMDSHEERVANQIKIAQERAAKSLMDDKAKELKKKRDDALKKGIKSSMSSANAISSSNANQMVSVTSDFANLGLDTTASKLAPTKAPARPAGGGKALKLGAKDTSDDQFMRQLQNEGQNVVTDMQTKTRSKETAQDVVVEPVVNRKPVHLRCIERLSATVSRDGGLEACEIIGTVTLNISDPQFQTVSIQMKNEDKSGAQLQVHPNLDRKTWQTSSMLQLKSAQKPFPVNVDVGVLKWRIQLPDEEALPLSINCWPNESPDGVTVNIEYTLQIEDMQLNKVAIAIPLPPATSPTVSECEGSYEYVKSRSVILWTIDVIDSSNKNGTLEFSTPNGHADHFFPVNVKFYSENLFCKLSIVAAQKHESSEKIEFSEETRLIAEKYEVV
uniref:Coatomer subunit delta n=1 Tax=Acrobeloides nanus TaxID=290746 RepID=A0A914EKA7_9BILA